MTRRADGMAFLIGDHVTITAMGVAGLVIGRADHMEKADRFLVRFRLPSARAADDATAEAWFAADHLKLSQRRQRRTGA